MKDLSKKTLLKEEKIKNDNVMLDVPHFKTFCYQNPEICDFISIKNCKSDLEFTKLIESIKDIDTRKRISLKFINSYRRFVNNNTSSNKSKVLKATIRQKRYEFLKEEYQKLYHNLDDASENFREYNDWLKIHDGVDDFEEHIADIDFIHDWVCELRWELKNQEDGGGEEDVSYADSFANYPEPGHSLAV